MSLLGLKTFRHGVHPPERKDGTSGSEIRQFPFAPLLIVPLVQHLGTEEFPRLRVGVGRPQGRRIATKEGEGELVDHVLGAFSGEELPAVETAEARAAEAVLDWIRRQEAGEITGMLEEVLDGQSGMRDLLEEILQTVKLRYTILFQ